MKTTGLTLTMSILMACAADPHVDDPIIDSSESALDVPGSDLSGPTPVLLAMEEQGANKPAASVDDTSTGGQTLTASSKTAKFSILAFANDPESGVRDLTVWCAKKTETCNDATSICSLVGPGLLSAPTFGSERPASPPGTDVSEGSILFDVLDLSSWVPAGGVGPQVTRTVTVSCFAKARNHLGPVTETPNLDVTFTEHYVPPIKPPLSCFDECVAGCKPTCPSGKEYKGCMQECRVDCRDACGP